VIDELASEELVKVEGSLTIERVSEVRAALLAGLTQVGPLRCDLSAVDRCDTAGIQLLCSAMATAALACRSLTVVAASSAVLAAASRIGVPGSAIGYGVADAPEEQVWENV
jgi:anti-anti-sigma regulatory factor